MEVCGARPEDDLNMSHQLPKMRFINVVYSNPTWLAHTHTHSSSLRY